MNKIINVLYALLTLVCVGSCTDSNIGSALADKKLFIVEDSSFVITGHSVANPRLQARTSSQLLGVIRSEGYGTLSSDVVTQFMPVLLIDTVRTSAAAIDSCKLRLRIPATGGFTGDSLATMRLNVYRLKKQLPSPIYSDFDPTDYYDPDELLASVPYSPAAAELFSFTADGGATFINYRDVYVTLPVEVARDIFTEFKQNPATFSSPKLFAQFFPGLYITNSYGSGRVMNFTHTEIISYFRRTYKATDGSDSIVVANQTYLGATPEVLSDNIIHLDIDKKIQDMVDAGDAIIMAPAGYEVQVKFPIQEIIDAYLSGADDDLSIVNALSMELPVEPIATEYKINPPDYLLMVKTSMKDQFIAGDSLTNNKDSFYAKYDPKTRKYVFSGMRDYVLNILKNKLGVADEEDINLTITPVDVTTYTNATASYYYTTTSTTTVTKIAPQVSKPAIAKIRFDKAKIKISFSKQFLF